MNKRYFSIVLKGCFGKYTLGTTSWPAPTYVFLLSNYIQLIDNPKNTNQCLLQQRESCESPSISTLKGPLGKLAVGWLQLPQTCFTKLTSQTRSLMSEGCELYAYTNVLRAIALSKERNKGYQIKPDEKTNNLIIESSTSIYTHAESLEYNIF